MANLYKFLFILRVPMWTHTRR